MKQYLWNELIKDISDALRMSQSQIADECKVTQQTVSNWTTNARKPGIYAQEKVICLAERAGITVGDYLLTMSGSEDEVVNQIRACLRGLDEAQRLVAVRVLATLSDNLRKM